LAAIGGTGSADADTLRTFCVPGDAPLDVTPLDVTPLTSSSSWTGVLMKHLPCPTHPVDTKQGVASIHPA